MAEVLMTWKIGDVECEVKKDSTGFYAQGINMKGLLTVADTLDDLYQRTKFGIAAIRDAQLAG